MNGRNLSTISFGPPRIAPRLAPVLVFLMMLLGGCGVVPKVVSRGAVGYLEAGAVVFQQESDPALAREAIPANFKLLEILLYKTPHDRRLLSLASQYLATYAYAFVEPEIEFFDESDPAKAAVAHQRASDLYLRCRDYGLRALEAYPDVIAAIDGTLEQRQNALRAIRKRDSAALFWTGFCWGSYVNLNLDVPEALADSSIVTDLMARAHALNETYYYGGTHLFYGAFYSRLPKEAGGDPEKSRQHFESAIAISQGKLLMTKVFYARYYAVRIQNRLLFHQTLTEVLNADISQFPDERLANTLAKDRARFYLERENDYFFEP